MAGVYEKIVNNYCLYLSLRFLGAISS